MLSVAPPPAGEVFYPPSLEKLTWQQAGGACRGRGSVLASPGQLFAAWRAGLNRCDLGWLSDGSVRYPVTVARPQCGGGLLGVRTLYRNQDQTGFPDPAERHGAYCFKGEEELRVPVPSSYWTEACCSPSPSHTYFKKNKNAV